MSSIPSEQAALGDPAMTGNSPKGNPAIELLCWGFILAMVSMLFAMNLMEQNAPRDSMDDKPAHLQAEVQTVDLQARIMVGSRRFVPAGTPQAGSLEMGKDDLQTAANDGPLWQRYAYTPLIAETSGAETAMEHLDSVDRAIVVERYEADEREKKAGEALRRVMKMRAETADKTEPDDFAPEDVSVLRKELGWLGELAVTPRGDGKKLRPGIDDRAVRTFGFAIVGVIVAIALAIAAFTGFVVAIVQFSRRKLSPLLPDQAESGTVYLESFAVWLFAYQFGSLVIMTISTAIVPGLNPLFAAPMTTLFSLGAALLWPVFRGLSFQRVREDIGLFAANPFREVFFGLWGYACTLVLLLVSILIVIPLARVLNEDKGLAARPSLHPIQEILAGGDFVSIAMVVFLAAVTAPVVEEIVFRGLLFRYLRDRSQSWGRLSSVICSIFVTGLVFAAIHPQSIVGLPPLFALATGMALLRQWRSSLVAAMTLHAVNNFLITMLTVLTRV